MRSVGDGEVVEFDVVIGEKGHEAANVTGPSGEAVKGSPYAADKRRGYRGGHWYISQRRGNTRTQRRPREGQDGYETGERNRCHFIFPSIRTEWRCTIYDECDLLVNPQARVRPETKRTPAREADSSDVTEFDDNTTATIVARAVLVHRRNNKGTTPAKVASKAARSATGAYRAAVAADAEDHLAVTSAVISAGEEVADLRVVLVARTAK